MMRVIQISWAQQYRPAPVMVLRGCARGAARQAIAFKGLTYLYGRFQEAMRDFRSGKVTTLVATDVAGRGLHISRWASGFRPGAANSSRRVQCIQKATEIASDQL